MSQISAKHPFNNYICDLSVPININYMGDSHIEKYIRIINTYNHVVSEVDKNLSPHLSKTWFLEQTIIILQSEKIKVCKRTIYRAFNSYRKLKKEIALWNIQNQ